MTLKTKALVNGYYGTPQSFAYVDGCSGGGRQGFAEAQSFPTDYNGILAGAPSIAQTRFFPSDLYPGFVQYKDLGSYSALTDGQLALVAGSAVSACDTTLTGQHDGYIAAGGLAGYTRQRAAIREYRRPQRRLRGVAAWNVCRRGGWVGDRSLHGL